MKRKPKDVTRMIMREAYLQGFNVKSIAGYFRKSIYTVYNNVNIAGLKSKIQKAKE